jgi:hypothetical protein
VSRQGARPVGLELVDKLSTPFDSGACEGVKGGPPKVNNLDAKTCPLSLRSKLDMPYETSSGMTDVSIIALEAKTISFLL